MTSVYNLFILSISRKGDLLLPRNCGESKENVNSLNRLLSVAILTSGIQNVCLNKAIISDDWHWEKFIDKSNNANSQSNQMHVILIFITDTRAGWIHWERDCIHMEVCSLINLSHFCIQVAWLRWIHSLPRHFDAYRDIRNTDFPK